MAKYVIVEKYFDNGKIELDVVSVRSRQLYSRNRNGRIMK